MKTLTIEQLAEKLHGKLWIKGDLKRIYLDEGWNTKKMSTKTYVYEKDARFIVVCNIECPSQPDEWISSQEDQIINSVNERIQEIIEEFGFEIEDPQIAIQAALDAEPQVKGYYMYWHSVRVPINSYGKLAIRKRQQVRAYNGPVSKTPFGFIELNDEDYAIALEKEEKQINYEYGAEPNLVGEAKRRADRESALEEQRIKDSENRRIAEQKEQADKKIAAEELQKKVAALKESGITSPLLAWKELGFPHPAPAEVVEAKIASGLNWKSFQNSI